MGVTSAFGVLGGGDASSVSLSELPPPVYPGSFASSLGSAGAVTEVLGLASLLAVPGVEVVSTVGVLEGGEASSVSLFELSPPVCPDPFVSSFGSVGAVPQVFGVASLLVTPEVWVVSNRGMFEGGEASPVFLSELPPALWSCRGWVHPSSRRYG